jgi:hypothetical protein
LLRGAQSIFRLALVPNSPMVHSACVPGFAPGPSWAARACIGVHIYGVPHAKRGAADVKWKC